MALNLRTSVQRVVEVVFSLVLCYHLCTGQYEEAFEKVGENIMAFFKV